MSPLQISTLIGAIFCTAAKIMTSSLETAAGVNIVPAKIAVLLTMCCTVTWGLFGATFTRDQVARRLDRRLDEHLSQIEMRLRRDIAGFGELCTEDGRRDAAREFARTMPTQKVRSDRILSPVD